MYKFLLKNGQAVAFGVGLLAVAIFLGSAITGLTGAGYDMGTDLMKLTEEQRSDIGFFDPGIKLTVALIAISFVLAFVVFGLLNLLKFPKSAIKFGLGIVALLAVFGILYSQADAGIGGPLSDTMAEFKVDENASKFISAGMWTTIGLLGAAVVAMVGAEIRNAFK